MHWSEVWEGRSVGATAARALLLPASWLYEAGWRAYRATYDLGLKKAREPHKPIFCVGNLTVGGSGKSPVTMHLADVIAGLGRKVVLSCSGYGSPASEAARMAPDGPLSPMEWGDEPAMFRWLRPELPVVVGRNRVRAAELCHQEFPDAVMLMDDGFQHLPLRKHLTMLLMDQGRNRHCLPAGPYREPFSFQSRADLVLPGDFSVVAEPMTVQSAEGEPLLPTRVRSLCAIGSPGRFFAALESAGYCLEASKALPDHDRLDAGNLFEGWPEKDPVVVTAKDWVKLRERRDIVKRTIWIARQDVAIEPQAAFQQWIESRLNELSE